MGKWPEKESDLAEPVIAYLEDLKWEVFQEVQCGFANDIADIVARQGRLVWVIELKRSLSLEVIAQANLWRRYTHYASVAIPTRRSARASKGRRLADQVMAWKGVGCLKIAGPEYGSEARVIDAKQSSLNRHAQSKRLHDWLCDEHKHFAKAGNSEGKRWTPFQRTCRAVTETVARKPGLSMKELVEAVDHHYASDAGARAHLADWIRGGVVKGVEIRQEGRLLRVYPSVGAPVS